jgi:hypothetical protein
MSDPNELHTLSNGGEVPSSVVKLTMMILEGIARQGLKGTLLLHDIKSFCEGDKKALSPHQIEELKSTGLFERHGEPHQAVKDVMLSAIKVEGLTVSVKSPYSKDSPYYTDAAVENDVAKIMEGLGLTQKKLGRTPGE